MASYLEKFQGEIIDSANPLVLFETESHKVYWLGIDEAVAFRCNVYMIESGDECIIIDPGNKSFFPKVKSMIEKIGVLDKVSAIIVCHQDPDVSASLYDWLLYNQNIKVISSPRTNVLLPHYGISDYYFYDITETNFYEFKNGHKLQFIEAPFLHFPGAFATLDITSQFLFSGDVWAALDVNWKLLVDNFSEHEIYLDLFHIDYMASNVAARGFARKLRPLTIDAILPQHGSIINNIFVDDAITYLENLQCGTDIIYSDI